MAFLKFLSLALLGLQASMVMAEKSGTTDDDSIVVENAENLAAAAAATKDAPQLKMTASGSIAHSEIFGIKLVNNVPSHAILSFNNSESGPLTVAFVMGSLATPQTGVVVRNLTSKGFNKEIAPGQSVSFTYSFAVDMHPQDLELKIVAMVSDSKKAFYTVPVMKETVAVVEAPISIFDPQTIFLYLVLGAAFGGTCYFIYSTWIVPLLPQQQRKPRSSATGAAKLKKASTAASTHDTSATATGSKGYDESWIPEQHLKRPVAKTVKSSGTTKNKS